MAKIDFGSRLRAARAFRDWTQEELATRLNVSQGTVASWESKATARMVELPKIAHVLGVSLDYLIGKTDCMGVK